MQNQITKNTDLVNVGEAISHELGAKMVKDYQDANPSDTPFNIIGRNILEKILAQPGCAGICFYNAINELGKKTLVYVGVDHNNTLISKYVGINSQGELVNEDGIVADRAGSSIATSTTGLPN